MSDRSAIEWTDATWNPIVGCSIVSPGCTNCYAMKMAARIEKMNRTGGSGSNYVNHYDGTTKSVNGNVVWTGKLTRAPKKTLLAPLGRKTPTKYFVNSMGDLFHEDCPDEWIDQVFAVMALCPHHTFQVLTKRAERMRDYITSVTFSRIDRAASSLNAKHCVPAHSLFTNVWLGVSCERQEEADERIPLLLQTPAAVRFISAEPLLGPVDLDHIVAPEKVEGEDWRFSALQTGDMYDRRIENEFDARVYWDSGDGPYRDHALDWVIVGGESGPNARPMHPDWARALRDQCAAAGVAFFYKQWGEFFPLGEHLPGHGRVHGCTAVRPGWHKLHVNGSPTRLPDYLYPKGAELHVMAGTQLMFRVGKKAAGRLLDGREHNDFPDSITPREAAA
jgi:protein gp37